MVGRGSERGNVALGVWYEGSYLSYLLSWSLEINKTLIVVSRWFLYYLTYIEDARSNTNQYFMHLITLYYMERNIFYWVHCIILNTFYHLLHFLFYWYRYILLDTLYSTEHIFNTEHNISIEHTVSYWTNSIIVDTLKFHWTQCIILRIDGLGGLVVRILATGTRVRGFKPGCPENPQYAFLRRVSKRISPMSQLCGM